MPRPAPNHLLARLVRATRRFLHRFRTDHPKVVHPCLCGDCAIGTLILYRVLLRLGYEAMYVLGWFKHEGQYCSHAWLYVGKRLVDVTATQFGLPAVFIGRKNDPRYIPYAADERAIEGVRRWGLGQSPIHYTVSISTAVERIAARLG